MSTVSARIDLAHCADDVARYSEHVHRLPGLDGTLTVWGTPARGIIVAAVFTTDETGPHLWVTLDTETVDDCLAELLA